MNGAEIAALIAAVAGALGAIFKGVRDLKGDKFRKEVEASASLLSGYTNMVGSLQAEIDRLKSDHAEDRATWAAERTAMRHEHHTEIARMREEHRLQLLEVYERIDDLNAKVYVLHNRPKDTRDRSTDE